MGGLSDPGSIGKFTSKVSKDSLALLLDIEDAKKLKKKKKKLGGGGELFTQLTASSVDLEDE